MFYSPLRYPGGKSCLSDYFCKVIKKNKLSNIRYIEPYAGGAGAALSLLLLEKVESILINDLDRGIYAFWKSMLYNTDEFIDKINSTPININEWQRQRRTYKDKNSKMFDLGFATFFLNRTNRSGIVEGGPIGGYSQRGKWKINARFNKKDLADRIKRIALHKNKITVLNIDGIELLKKIKNKKDLFIYLDPPYHKKGNSLYLNHYKDKDHKKLAQFLNTNSELNWLLTYDNSLLIENLYRKRKIEKFDINYSAHTKRVDKELMIFSDSLAS